MKRSNRVLKCVLALIAAIPIAHASAHAESAGEIVFYQSSSTQKPTGGAAKDSSGRTQRPPDRNRNPSNVQGPLRATSPQATTPAQTGRPNPRTGASAPGANRPTAANRTPASKPPANRGQRGGGRSSLVLEDAPIQDLIDTVMKELNYSYVIDPQVSGNVSVHINKGVPADRLFSVLEQLLQMNGLAIIQQGEDFFAIVPIGLSTRIPNKILLKPGMLKSSQDAEEDEEGDSKKDAEKKGKTAKSGKENGAEKKPPSGSEKEDDESGRLQGSFLSRSGQGPALSRVAFPSAEPMPLSAPQQQQPQQQVPPGVRTLEQSAEARQIENERGVITYVIPLNFIPSADFLTMAQVYMSDGATVVDFVPSNIIMITDYRANIQQILNLVNLLDTQYFDLNNIDLVPIRFNQAVDVAEDLGKVFAPNETAAGVRIVAIERLNSILIVTHGPEVLAQVKDWIEKLDSTSAGTNLKTYIYQVENNTADNIAQILGELYSDGFGLPSSTSAAAQASRAQGSGQSGQAGRPRQEAGFAPQPQERPTQQRPRQQPTGQRFGQRPGQGQGGQAGSPALGPSLSQRPSAASGIRSVVSGNVKIIVNEFNNSLIIQSTEADYQFLLQTIRQLDILPRQVIIEAEIYQVQLDDDLSFGVNLFLEQREASGEGIPNPFPATIANSNNGALSLATRTTIGATRQLRAMISALRAKTNVQMLDAPRILTMDGVEASINIGAEIPVSTTSFSDPVTSGNTSFVNSIQFRPTGTTLLIIPRISASGIVTLELSLEVSSSASVLEGGSTNLTPIITRSAIETTLLCRDNQSVAMGGIISESETETKNRVPLLGDIPVLGALFGRTVHDRNRNELIFIITPRVIQNLPTAVELTLDFKRALRNAYGFIDEMKKKRSDLIEKRRQEELQNPKQDQ